LDLLACGEHAEKDTTTTVLIMIAMNLRMFIDGVIDARQTWGD